jgi:hypothetical protein
VLGEIPDGHRWDLPAKTRFASVSLEQGVYREPVRPGDHPLPAALMPPESTA